MQTILGAGGAIGQALARELTRYTTRIRLVSRTPKPVLGEEELLSADLLDPDAVDRAVAGSEVVYLTAGLQYNRKVWQELWPRIMQHVIDACIRHGAKLVFFDNVYMYDAAAMGQMTEEAPINPPSEKGKVRARIAEMLLSAVRDGRLTALIARSADFYGPGVQSSVMIQTIYNNLKKGKKGAWMGDADKVHSATFVADAARATALLGNTADAYNQVWHLPTDPQRITGRQWVDSFAACMGRPSGHSKLSKGLLRLGGLFVPMLRELPEMYYQNDRDYFFDSSKFTRRFPDFEVTSYADGIRQCCNNGD